MTSETLEGKGSKPRPSFPTTFAKLPILGISRTAFRCPWMIIYKGGKAQIETLRVPAIPFSNTFAQDFSLNHWPLWPLKLVRVKVPQNQVFQQLLPSCPPSASAGRHSTVLGLQGTGRTHRNPEPNPNSLLNTSAK